jgi:hypothetical protein
VGRRKGQDLFYILGGGKVAAGGVSAGPTAGNKAPTKIGGAPKVAAAAPVKAAVGSKPHHVGGAKPIGGAHKDAGDSSKL